MGNNYYKIKTFITRQILLRILLILFLIIMSYPLVWLFMSSFKTNAEYMKDPFGLPDRVQFNNYVDAIRSTNMLPAIKNSGYVILVTLVVLLICSVPCSYVVSRYRNGVTKTIGGLILSCLFVDASYIIIPLFLEMRAFKLLNNLTALGVLYAVFHLPYSVFLVSGFMEGIPKDYEEAAILDGCSPMGVLRHIVIPLSKSVIFTVSMITVLSAWGEYVVSLTLVTDPAKQTFTVAIAKLNEVARYATNWGALFAALSIGMIPTLVLFLVGEKYAVKGIAIGGLKG